MVDKECPIDAVDKALCLASRIEVEELPLDFDPGDVRWREILTAVAQRYSNHGTLLEELHQLLNRARLELGGDCELVEDDGTGEPYIDCKARWLAEYRLWEAALEAAERAYQRLLARQALHRAATGDT